MGSGDNGEAGQNVHAHVEQVLLIEPDTVITHRELKYQAQYNTSCYNNIIISTRL